MMNKQCKNHKPLLVTELTFHNKQKSRWKNPFGFLLREPGCYAMTSSLNYEEEYGNWDAAIKSTKPLMQWLTPANSIHSFVNELLLHECVSVLPQGSFKSCGQLLTTSYCQALILKPFHDFFVFVCFMLYDVFVFWRLTSCWTDERCTLVMWCQNVFNIVFISVVELERHVSWCVLTERPAVGVLRWNCEKSRLCLNLQRETV